MSMTEIEKKTEDETVETAEAGENALADLAVAAADKVGHEQENPPQKGKENEAPHDKGYQLKELIKRGKSKGSLSNSEIMEALDDDDYDIEQIEKLYETLENMGIEVTGYMDAPDFEIENEVAQLESAEEMEKMLIQEGLAIDDPVRMYLKEIGKVQLLDSDTELGLAEKMYDGKRAKEKLDDAEKNGITLPEEEAAALKKRSKDGITAEKQLVESNLRLVVSIAKRYVGKGMFFLDLIQEGNLGLMKAVDKFDYKK